MLFEYREIDIIFKHRMKTYYLQIWCD